MGRAAVMLAMGCSGASRRRRLEPGGGLLPSAAFLQLLKLRISNTPSRLAATAACVATASLDYGCIRASVAHAAGP